MSKHFNMSVAVKTFQKYPCQTCTERHVGCHGKCEKYQAARAEQNKKNDEKFKHKITDTMLNSFQFENIRKQDRAKGKKS